jgi:hypothetical protein
VPGRSAARRACRRLPLAACPSTGEGCLIPGVRADKSHRSQHTRLEKSILHMAHGGRVVAALW